MNIHAILKFLRELAEKDRQWQAEKTKDELYTAFRFNPFRFFRTDEMGLSAVLAFLLNPKETHGQRDYFLKSFLEYLNLHEYLAYDQVEVHTEKKFDGRPHDIVLIGKLKGKQHWIISIENKLKYASDQPNQINDYLESLKKRYSQYHLVYMPVWNVQPSSISEDDWQKAVDENKASIFSAQRMIEWLENCVIISSRIQQFVADFSNYIKTGVLGMSENSNKLVSEIIKNSNDVKMALNLANLKDDIYRNLLKELVVQLRNIFNKNGFNQWKQDGHNDKRIGKTEHNFFYSYAPNKELSIILEFEAKGFNSLFFSIWFDLEGKNNKRKKYRDLLKQLFIDNDFEYENGNRYMVWKYFPDNLLNWNNETFSKIPSGELAEEIWQEIEPYCQKILASEIGKNELTGEEYQRILQKIENK